jgi:hypothetical protein
VRERERERETCDYRGPICEGARLTDYVCDQTLSSTPRSENLSHSPSVCRCLRRNCHQVLRSRVVNKIATAPRFDKWMCICWCISAGRDHFPFPAGSTRLAHSHLGHWSTLLARLRSKNAAARVDEPIGDLENGDAKIDRKPRLLSRRRVAAPGPVHRAPHATEIVSVTQTTSVRCTSRHSV